MHRIAILVAAAFAAVAVAALAAASPSRAGDATVSIRHQVAHCHTWSVNGGPFRASQRLSVRRGATISFVDNDVMPHQLVQLAGAHVAMQNTSTMGMGGGMRGSATPGLMNHMGAATQVRLTKPGVYRFRTRAGEDYRSGFKTTGEDNVLTLTVLVR